jgi:hypothetical protein
MSAAVTSLQQTRTAILLLSFVWVQSGWVLKHVCCGHRDQRSAAQRGTLLLVAADKQHARKCHCSMAV